MIVEPAERMDEHDRRDHEQEDCALAAVAAVDRLVAAVEPDSEAEDEDRCDELDHAPGAHARTPLRSPWTHSAMRNSSIAVAAIISRRPKRRAWSTVISP